jgi:hypothetical protein
MSLSELLENRFRGDIRFRGVAYLKAERVSLSRISADHVFGLVRDGVEYQTHLSREEGTLRMFCNCNTGTNPEASCKHLWATILAVDEAGILTATPTPSFVPPFSAEPDIPPLSDDWDEDDTLLGDVYRPTAAQLQARAAATGTATPVAPTPERVQIVLKPWEAELKSLRSEIRTAEPVTPTAGRDREIFYEIDVEQTKGVGQLVLETSQRQRRANGQWGKLKPLKLRAGQFDDVDHADDCTILAYLQGGSPERTNWYAQQAETQAAVSRYRLPTELCQLILPLMCATGRVRYQGNEEKGQPPLEWDAGEPWELTMKLSREGTGKKPTGDWKLDGSLRRGTETLAISDTEILIPGGLVLTKTHIARLNDFAAFPWVPLLTKPEGLKITDGDQEQFVDQLLDMPALPRLELPEELKLEEISVAPVPHLTVRSPKSERWHMERLLGEVSFEYAETIVPGGGSQWAIVQRDQGRCLVRDRAAEDKAWALLQEHGFRRLIDQRRTGKDVEVAARDLGPAVRHLVSQGWMVRADGKSVRQPGEINFRIKSNIDWFELHADVDFEGRTVSFPELLSALARGDSTVRLDDGSLGIIPEDWLKKYGLLAGIGSAEGDHVKFAAHQVALLDALLAAQPSVDMDAKFAEFRDQFKSFSGIIPASEPTGFKGELRGYQREGLGWLEFLQKFQFGGCLADDMGLGKTVQLLALLLERKRLAAKKLPSLVVVPKSLLFNWRQECERFTPSMKVLEYTGLDRAQHVEDFPKYDIILTTYGTLRRDVVQLKDVAFDYVVLDEAQTIKNSGSQVAKAARLLQSNHRVALSGTPIENHLGDLWSIFEFLNPGMLGRSSIFKSYATDAQDDQTRRLLSQGLRPFILRRTKKQVAAELPDKFEQTIVCDMGTEQRRLYEELRDHYRDSLLGLVREQGMAKSKMHVLEALLRLRQASCHPALLDRGQTEESSAKLDVLIPYIEELLDEGHKALVFSQFTSMLAIVREHLDKKGIVYEYLDGQTRDREARVNRFQSDPDCGLFLISLKAGGLGLNLTAADYVFILDPWWNPAVETQAIDRAHRVGQNRQVFAYRIICRDTVEEKIAELQSRKRDLAEAILEADGTLLRNLSSEDLELLLS